MNNGNKNQHVDDYRFLLVLDEISKNGNLTQRDLSKNLGIALGLINSYLKNLISKGCITVSQIPRKRYKYYLTPKGFSEKTRLTYEHLRNFTNLYRVARRDFSGLFYKVESAGLKKIVFCGVDEVAEIAYLSLKETMLELLGVVDNKKAGTRFFDYTVGSLEEARFLNPELIVLTSNDSEELKKALIETGVREEVVCDISGGDWLKRLK